MLRSTLTAVKKVDPGDVWCDQFDIVAAAAKVIPNTVSGAAISTAAIAIASIEIVTATRIASAVSACASVITAVADVANEQVYGDKSPANKHADEVDLTEYSKRHHLFIELLLALT